MTPALSPHCSRAYTPLYVALSQQSASDPHLKLVRCAEVVGDPP